MCYQRNLKQKLIAQKLKHGEKEKPKRKKPKVPHISFSALKNWDFCPFYHKLTYIEKIKLFRGNVHTAFGTSVHSGCEKLVLNEAVDPEPHFSQEFKDQLESLPEDVEKDAKLIEQMRSIGGALPKYAIAELHKKFPGFKVVSVEEEIVEPILDVVGEYDFIVPC